VTAFSPVGQPLRRQPRSEASDRAQLEHVYVCTSYPSFSETFVATEALALEEHGESVWMYSLRPPPKALCPSLRYLCDPVTRLALVRWLIPGFGLILASWKSGLRFSPRSSMRLIYASAHAARLNAALAKTRRSTDSSVTVIHAHFLGRPADVAGLVPSEDVVKLVTVHAGDALDARDPSLRSWRLRSFDHVICASHYTRDAIAADDVSAPISVVRCGVVPPAAVVRRQYMPGEPIRFCTVARLVQTKGLDYAAEVIRRLAARGYTVRWDVVGDGPLARWL